MFQSFSPGAHSFEQPQAPAPRSADEARELLRRYPNLSDIELARLIHLYRELSALEMALILSDETLAPGLDRFSAENRSKIRAPFRQYAALVGYAVIGLAVVAWAVSFAG
jgi:hypothetical protein